MADESGNPDAGAVHAAFACGAAGAHRGPVVGCCYRCGLLLCAEHVYHLPRPRDFGRTATQRATPLVCGTHTFPGGRKGLPNPPRKVKHPKRRAPRLPGLPPLGGRRRSRRLV